MRNIYCIVIFLLAVESFVLYISSRKDKYFKFIPPVFWIYFLPMLASTAGIIDSKSPVYQVISINILPASLVLLLMSSDIKPILKLEKPALIMMFAGSLGMMLGFPLVFLIFKQWVGFDMWKGFGALAASWTGGSANMIAVKEATGATDAVFAPMVIVDTVVPYIWMGILIALAGFAPKFDKWNKSDTTVLEKIGKRTAIPSPLKKRFNLGKTMLILFIAAVSVVFSRFLAGLLPSIKDIISGFTWVILIISFLGISLSFTRLKNLGEQGASKIGYFLLYFVLTSIGARANITNFNAAVLLILAGFLIVLIHAVVLLITSRVIKAPLSLIAIASQANIGGVASTPVVAEIYHPGLATAGLLLAILGNIIGTYCGIVTGQLCRLIAR